MYFEIFSQGNLIKRGRELLGGLRFSNELMYTPALNITLPITYREFFSGREEMKIFVNNKCFWGIVLKITENKDDETIDIGLEHVIREWTYRQISVNNAIKDKNINIVFKGSEVKEYGNISVSANPFDMLLVEVGRLTTAQYIARAGAVAWNSATGESLPVTAVDTSKIKSKPGNYNVAFSIASGESVTVKVTVKKLEGMKTRTANDITIAAMPFEMTVSEVGRLNDAEYISRAHAMAWNKDGEDVAVTAVDKSKIKAAVGSYSVKFTASVGGKTSSITVKVKVLKAGADIDNDYDDVINDHLNADPSVIDQLSDIYADTNFAYPGWRMNYSGGASGTMIDYVYSRQNKLDALTKTMELTPDLFWRVRLVNEKVVDVGAFGEQKQWIISMKPSGVNNIRLIEEPAIEYDFENVINLATVYSEKSDSGMSSMTLREVYNDPSLQLDGFPCVILRANVNNERDYRMYSTQYPKLAPNNELEYAVIDEESVALESGYLIEGTYSFNDLSPFTEEKDDDGKTKEVTDKDRIEAAKTAYHAVVRKLKQARRSYKISLTTEELPADLAPGDKVRFLYDNQLYIVEECSSYMKKVLSYNDWFYVTAIDYDIDGTGAEVNSITLEKYLHIDRETINE